LCLIRLIIDFWLRIKIWLSLMHIIVLMIRLLTIHLIIHISYIHWHLLIIILVLILIWVKRRHSSNMRFLLSQHFILLLKFIYLSRKLLNFKFLLSQFILKMLVSNSIILIRSFSIELNFFTIFFNILFQFMAFFSLLINLR
jgi:hypothetical protein